MTGSRQYSEDLPQGGLEIPCVLTFEGNAKHTAKAKKLLETTLTTTATDLPASKKRKLSDVPVVLPATSEILPATSEVLPATSERASELTSEWVQHAGIVLERTEKEHILTGEKLNDSHINMAQGLLKRQFSEVTGLNSTLLQAKKQTKQDNKQQIQIIHSRGDHWLVASTVLSSKDEVKVYDSVYRTIDRTTRSIISNLFQSSSSTELVKINRQTGGRDCGVYAIAISTALAFHHDPSLIKFDQPAMRPHLVACLEKGTFSPFPTI